MVRFILHPIRMCNVKNVMAEATPQKHHPDWKNLTDTHHAVQDAETLRQESIIAHHDHLITEIETSDGPLGTTLRSVYEGGELDQFKERLNNHITSHDKEIERMCNYHYQGFIDSIRELLKVSTDAAQLKEEIQAVNNSLQDSCSPLMTKGEELVRCRRIQRNIAAAIENLNLCLPVLEMYGKLQDQMKTKRYYPALKTLEQLEHTYLPRVSDHWFSQTMAEAIPKLREKIKDASMSELKDFLENIRKHSAKIGEVAMRHAAEQNNMDPKIVNARKKPRKRRAPKPPNPFTGEIEEEEGDIRTEEEPTIPDDLEESGALSAQDLIDFSPVYRCLHIYTVLGDREKFETYYRKQRRKQARLSLQPPPNMNDYIDNYKRYFHDIVGFFVVEDHILSTTQGLVNRAYMDELWEMSVSKLAASLRTNASSCKDSSMMLDIKKLIVLFCHTLKGYGFSVGHLLELLLEMSAQNDSIHIARLHGTSMFKDARSDAEDHIYKQLNDKMDEFLELASYDWLIPEARGHASGYITDLVAFLQSIFMSFTNLPEKVAKTACMSACKYISSKLMEFLLDNEVKQITMGALQQFNLDLMQCEQFAASEPVPGNNDGTLLLAFTDLRQLLDLFLNWDWSVYLADYGQPKSKYLRVQPHAAISLLEKLNNADKKKNNLFQSLKKNERDKKKLLDTVLKQLRGLVNGTAPQVQG
ncbi:hypothetical protein KUTeg_004823 [Tegillarca granosa]|uniref:Exocyst complex component n=1 Tax=Tegillarca granosa TaxID=220873 RepID=A0ABQ9FI27_TEGGR|nr:hypothetical protein KUTeg_004823 [Tegillarca granosa]